MVLKTPYYNRMDLKDFVRDTLVQITEGVKEAQEYVKGKGAVITPRTCHGYKVSTFFLYFKLKREIYEFCYK